ncbi:GerAB/ArcD/ProY family transporter [Bacillus sp. AFS031507]|uniref:GerAB/ArcD/ProY family transporter n=1 Tax=Bacillus sp. AFS031507 TaxID=2033496 RepID=UPI000BFDEABF|nr:GerAB/ArcD/ProY family transporter [Bacillus sp. AFS031507]PGY08450.1 spore gernimation protein KB [Bacillus sp. AFS031507]
MEKAKISGSQLFVLIVLFEMGSAILLGLGAEVKQDAWIAILFGLAGGIIVFFIYYRLYMYYPDLPLTSYLQKILGKWFGRFIGLLYIVYFIYIASRVLRDFGELLTTTIYNSTPLFVVNSLMILVIIYGIHKGFEVLARVGEIYFGVVYLTAILGMLLITFSGLIHLSNLTPILEHGLKPVIKTFLTTTLTFPFGEMVVFTMLLPFLNDKKNAKIVCLGGMILAGINITITAVINISVLGAGLFQRSTFPLLTTVGRIQIADFIERLDVLFMLYLIIGGFFKISIYYYAAVAGAADIFQFKNQRKLGFPIGMIVLFSSITIASNIAEFLKEGLVIVPIYLSWPFQIIIPSILLIIAFFLNRKKQTSSA